MQLLNSVLNPVLHPIFSKIQEDKLRFSNIKKTIIAKTINNKSKTFKAGPKYKPNPKTKSELIKTIIENLNFIENFLLPFNKK